MGFEKRTNETLNVTVRHEIELANEKKMLFNQLLTLGKLCYKSVYIHHTTSTRDTNLKSFPCTDQKLVNH